MPFPLIGQIQVRQSSNESDENTNPTTASKRKPSCNQNTGSPLTKSSPHGHSNQIIQQPLSSPCPNFVQNLNRSGTDTNTAISSANPNTESSDDNDVTGKFIVHIQTNFAFDVKRQAATATKWHAHCQMQ